MAKAKPGDGFSRAYSEQPLIVLQNHPHTLVNGWSYLAQPDQYPGLNHMQDLQLGHNLDRELRGCPDSVVITTGEHESQNGGGNLDWT